MTVVIADTITKYHTVEIDDAYIDCVENFVTQANLNRKQYDSGIESLEHVLNTHNISYETKYGNYGSCIEPMSIENILE